MASRSSLRVALKRHKEDEADHPSSSPPPPRKKSKSNAEACRAYKEKLKEDPEKFNMYVEKQRERCKQYRAKSTEEQKALQREQSRLRMQAMRARIKEQGGPATRATQDAKRAKWREEKRQQADKITPQKRRRINERRRAKYQEKKSASAKPPSVPTNNDALSNASSKVCIPSTPAAQRKALSRAKVALPKSPTKFARVLVDLHKDASPRKKAALQAIGMVSPHLAQLGMQVERMVAQLKKSRSKSSSHRRQVLMAVYRDAQKTSFNAPMPFTHKALCQATSRKLRKERKLQSEISDFYASAATSLPSKKAVSKKSGVAASVLQKPLQELHREFVESTGKSVSFSHFAFCRPAHVRPAMRNFLRQCLCEYCQNVSLKITALNRLAARFNNACRIRHAYHAVDLITCGRQEGKWQHSCVMQTCGQCDSSKLDEHLRGLRTEEEVKWQRWENKPVSVHGKEVIRKGFVVKQGNMQDLKRELKDEVVFLAGHLFRADWQNQQFQLWRQNIPRGRVVMVLDFAENFTCTFQDEIQAAHWHHEQVTVHPTVCYYSCPECQEPVTESLIFISDDRQHDHHAVYQFEVLAHRHLQDVRNINVSHIVQFTDGCAAQYKSKGPFHDISCSLKDFACSFERHYFGSRHGKGPSDGESAVVKSSATRAIKAGTAVISSPQELFAYCIDSPLNKQPEGPGCHHHLRTFFFVASAEINRARESAATLPGTRSLHAVKCVEEKALLTRQLSCACPPCQSGIEECEKLDIVGPWVKRTLKSAGPVHAQQLVHEDHPLADGPVQDQPRANSPVDQPRANSPVDQPPADQPPADTGAAVGDFCVVAVGGRNRSVRFYAKITEIAGEEFKVTFLDKIKGKETVYTWADSAWVTANDIVDKVAAPTLLPGRGIAFSFH